jgi:competence ComEA-like helix-hairpin-helix protein
MTGCFKSVARFCGLLVLVLWATQGLCANKKPPLHPVNLNTATSEQLQEVPGIGPATAEKILQARKSYGAFKSVDDLQAIKGIGPKRLEKMRKYLTVGKPAQTQKPGSQGTTSTKSPPAKKPQTPPADSNALPTSDSDDEEQ